jgi:hypothetical protein
MQQKVRIHEMAQGNAQNVQVIGKVTLVVHSIDERTKRVMFTVNPNITEYHETPKRQSIGYEAIDDTRQGNMTPNDPPFTVTIGGTKCRIAVESVGTEDGGQRRSYCDFVVDW